jgi:hypothetical protein
MSERPWQQWRTCSRHSNNVSCYSYPIWIVPKAVVDCVDISAFASNGHPPTLPSPGPSRPSPPWGRGQGEGAVLRSPPMWGRLSSLPADWKVRPTEGEGGDVEGTVKALISMHVTIDVQVGSIEGESTNRERFRPEGLPHGNGRTNVALQLKRCCAASAALIRRSPE